MALPRKEPSSWRLRYEALRKLNLKLDLTRGKPSAEQLALSDAMFADSGVYAADGMDCRNYGALEGLPEARKLFGEYLDAPAEQTFVVGNSSLAIMHDLIVQMMMRSVPDEYRWWDPHHNLRNRPVMLCPVPGYDRHHAICERYGIEMLPIPLKSDGPDMDAVEEILRSKKRWYIFGMWCVPKYSNPSGVTYSREVCERLAAMETWPGFRIFWDLAYNEHHLTDTPATLPNMLELCRKAKTDNESHANRVFVIGSTSKITHAGSGIAALAASPENMQWFREGLETQTIGHDKLAQLRHVRFLKDMDGIRSHMRKHRAIVEPKFEAVGEVLRRELGTTAIASWNKPAGGYFVSLQVKPGCAKRVVQLAGEAGVRLTPAGASFPYGIDPEDSHIRIAPTFPSLADVRQAMEVVAVCIGLAVFE